MLVIDLKSTLELFWDRLHPVTGRLAGKPLSQSTRLLLTSAAMDCQAARDSVLDFLTAPILCSDSSTLGTCKARLTTYDQGRQCIQLARKSGYCGTHENAIRRARTACLEVAKAVLGEAAKCAEHYALRVDSPYRDSVLRSDIAREIRSLGHLERSRDHLVPEVTRKEEES